MGEGGYKGALGLSFLKATEKTTFGVLLWRSSCWATAKNAGGCKVSGAVSDWKCRGNVWLIPSLSKSRASKVIPHYSCAHLAIRTGAVIEALQPIT